MAILLPDEGSKERSYQLKVPSKHIIPAEAIIVNKELGVGEFGIVQQGVWTNEEGDRVKNQSLLFFNLISMFKNGLFKKTDSSSN